MNDGTDAGRSSDRDGRVLILNPSAGSADHAERVGQLAADHGFEVSVTEEAGDAIDLAREAATESSLIAAGGGDGTLNEVVRGIVEADALPDVTFGVVPSGTGNNFAANVGITDVEQAFDVMEAGDVRRIDLGIADGRAFLNSCIGGLTAEASASTTPEAKSRFGVLAYVLSTLRTAVEFEGVPLHIETGDGPDEGWSGDAAFVLIGNGRRFPAEGRSQADMEDGRLDVTVIEDRPAFDLAGEAALARLLGADTPSVTRFLAEALSVSVLGDAPGTFSLDGEMTESRRVHVSVRTRVLRIHVGEAYEPDPDR